MRLTSRYSFLFKNTLLFAVANFANKLIVFLLLPFYTAFLTTEEYAVIDLIATAQQLVFPIVTLDITEAVIRFCMEQENDKRKVFTVAVWIVAAGNILLAVGSTAVLFASVTNSTYIVYFFFFCLLVSVNTLLSSFYRTIDKINVITVSSIVSTLVITTTNIVLIAVMGMGIDGYYISYILGNVIAIAYMLRKVDLRSYLTRISFEGAKEQLKQMLAYSVPLVPNALFWWVNSGLDRFFLTAISGLSIAGMYAAANKIPAILSTLAMIFQQSWGLSMFRENESTSRQAFFNEVFRAYNLFLLAITAGLIVFAKPIGYILLSKDFFEAWKWAPWLLLGFYTNSLCSFIGTEFTAAKKTVWILMTTVVSAGVNVCFNLMMIPRYAGLGAAVATCISYFVMLEIRVWILNRRFMLRIQNGRLLLEHFVLAVLTVSITRDRGTSFWILAGCVLVLLILEKQEVVFLLRKIKGIIGTRKH